MREAQRAPRSINPMISREALLFLARQEALKDYAVRFSFFKRMTTRFVAGENIEEAVAAIRALNQLGCTASFDHLNESVSSVAETQNEVREYKRILQRINETGIRSNVSIKLTQFGLGIDPELAYKNAREVVAEAARYNNFVRVDMEQSGVTQTTLDIFQRLRAEFDLNTVGIVLQAYLYRTQEDVKKMLRIPARIRICKGAYLEPPDVAFPEKKDVDDNYVKVMRMLLDSGVYHGIATHDENMLQATKDYLLQKNINKARFEFQMLYGVRRDLQEKLAKEGYNIRVYVPYGKHWYPYFMRRLAERPANVWFVLKNMLKG